MCEECGVVVSRGLRGGGAAVVAVVEAAAAVVVASAAVAAAAAFLLLLCLLLAGGNARLRCRFRPQTSFSFGTNADSILCVFVTARCFVLRSLLPLTLTKATKPTTTAKALPCLWRT